MYNQADFRNTRTREDCRPTLDTGLLEFGHSPTLPLPRDKGDQTHVDKPAKKALIR